MEEGGDCICSLEEEGREVGPAHGGTHGCAAPRRGRQGCHIGAPKNMRGRMKLNSCRLNNRLYGLLMFLGPNK
jgi:hypothetical protein